MRELSFTTGRKHNGVTVPVQLGDPFELFRLIVPPVILVLASEFHFVRSHITMWANISVPSWRNLIRSGRLLNRPWCKRTVPLLGQISAIVCRQRVYMKETRPAPPPHGRGHFISVGVRRELSALTRTVLYLIGASRCGYLADASFYPAITPRWRRQKQGPSRSSFRFHARTGTSAAMWGSLCAGRHPQLVKVCCYSGDLNWDKWECDDFPDIDVVRNNCGGVR